MDEWIYNRMYLTGSDLLTIHLEVMGTAVSKGSAIQTGGSCRSLALGTAGQSLCPPGGPTGAPGLWRRGEEGTATSPTGRVRGVPVGQVAWLPSRCGPALILAEGPEEHGGGRLRAKAPSGLLRRAAGALLGDGAIPLRVGPRPCARLQAF